MLKFEYISEIYIFIYMFKSPEINIYSLQFITMLSRRLLQRYLEGYYDVI